ncbi:MAG: GldG family protein [Candidatus Hydrogenedentes bacterium]|nr:GldG family protein [Candidatus Hydrogenedentota bacterium]
MKTLRTIFGAIALLAFILAVNILTIRQDPAETLVLVLGGTTVLSGIAWLVLSIVLMTGTAARRRNLAGLNNIIASVIFLAICIVIYAFVRRWDKSWDLTQEGRRDLSPQTIQVLENLNVDVEVLGLFTNTGLREIDIAEDKTKRFLTECQKHTGHLKTQYIDPQRELARLQAMGLTFADPQGTVVIRCGTRNKTIPLSGPQPRLEEREFTNALINVIQESKPKIGFLTGHGERDVSKPEATAVKKLLESEGYAPEPVAIDTSTGSLPEGYAILVINGFQAGAGGDLHPQEIAALDAYINGGGRLLILVDPEFGSAAGQRRTLFSWLEQRFGIVVGDDLLVSGVDQRLGQVSLMPDSAAVSTFQQYNLPDVPEFHGCFDQSNPITKNFSKRIDFLAARSVDIKNPLPEGVTASRILRTLPYAYAETNLDALRKGNRPSQDPGETMGSIGLGVAATLKTSVPIGDSGQTRDARAVVIGDSDFVSNQTVLEGGNLNLLLNSMAWLSEREELIAIRARGSEKQPIKLTQSDERRIAWISTLGVLHLVAAAGLITYLLRRKYQ